MNESWLWLRLAFWSSLLLFQLPRCLAQEGQGCLVQLLRILVREKYLLSVVATGGHHRVVELGNLCSKLVASTHVGS